MIRFEIQIVRTTGQNSYQVTRETQEISILFLILRVSEGEWQEDVVFKQGQLQAFDSEVPGRVGHLVLAISLADAEDKE